MFNLNFKSIVELATTFPTEEKCIEHLEELYWEGVPVSPFAPDAKVWKCKNGKYKCATTNKYFTVKTGTMFDNTKLGLPLWFMAIYLVTSHKKGISSCQLGRDLNISQKGAWFMLHRIRACFGIENQTQLEGIVEADEAMIGGKQKNRHKDKRFKHTGGRSTVDKDAVFGMVERGGKIVLVSVPDCERETLQPIIKKLVAPGSVFITDSWKGYNGLDSDYLQYMIKDTDKGYQNDYNPEIHTNTIEGSWKIVKNAVRDMYNHTSTRHLQSYLNECAYRINLRKTEESYKFNYLLLNSATRTKYRELTNDKIKRN